MLPTLSPGFLTDLEGQGCKLDQSQSGGYANRNIAGTNTPSQHAFGHAIRCSSAENPRGANTPSNLPSDVGDIAASHGLIWGGNWSGATRAIRCTSMRWKAGQDGVERRPTGQDAARLALWVSHRPRQATRRPDSLQRPLKPKPCPATICSARMNTVAPQAPSQPHGTLRAACAGSGHSNAAAANWRPRAAATASYNWDSGRLLRPGRRRTAECDQCGDAGWRPDAEAQRTLEGVPIVGPVLGGVSLARRRDCGAWRGLAALKGGFADAADAVVPPNRGGRLGVEVGPLMDVTIAADMPGFRGPTDLRGGADYARSTVENALGNRMVCCRQISGRGHSHPTPRSSRAAAGPTAGPAEPTGVPPPPPGAALAPRNRPQNSVSGQSRKASAPQQPPRGAIPDPRRAGALANLERGEPERRRDACWAATGGPDPVLPVSQRVRWLLACSIRRMRSMRKCCGPKPEDQGGARDTLDAIDRDRNEGMLDLLRRDAGQPSTRWIRRGNIARERRQTRSGAFDGEQPVDVRTASRLSMTR